MFNSWLENIFPFNAKITLKLADKRGLRLRALTDSSDVNKWAKNIFSGLQWYQTLHTQTGAVTPRTETLCYLWDSNRTILSSDVSVFSAVLRSRGEFVNYASAARNSNYLVGCGLALQCIRRPENASCFKNSSRLSRTFLRCGIGSSRFIIIIDNVIQ